MIESFHIPSDVIPISNTSCTASRPSFYTFPWPRHPALHVRLLPERVFYPFDIIALVPRQQNHIEAAGRRPPQLRHIISRRTQQLPLFHRRNAICRPSKQVVSAPPNLDKPNPASIPHHGIDLAERATEIPFHQYEVLPQQKLLRALLCFFSGQPASYKFTSKIPADFENLPGIRNINPNADLPTHN